MKNDFKVPAYLITLVIVACFTVLPFHAEIWSEIVGDSPMAATLAERNARYDMSTAPMHVAHVDTFEKVYLKDGAISVYLNGTLVETDFSEQECAELFYVKEEIAYRVLGTRVSIIAGDNGEF